MTSSPMMETNGKLVQNGTMKKVRFARYFSPQSMCLRALEDETDIPDEATGYLEFLNSESAKLKETIDFDDDDDEEEELEEESILESPLDSIEPYILFRNAFLGLLSPWGILSWRPSLIFLRLETTTTSAVRQSHQSP